MLSVLFWWREGEAFAGVCRRGYVYFFFLLQKIWRWLPYFVTKPPAANYRSVLCVSTFGPF